MKIFTKNIEQDYTHDMSIVLQFAVKNRHTSHTSEKLKLTIEVVERLISVFNFKAN